jgi:hypothetical protein
MVVTFLATVCYYRREIMLKERLRRECIFLHKDILELQLQLGEPLYGANLFDTELEQYSKSVTNLSWFKDRLKRHEATLLDKIDSKECNVL